MENSTGSCDGSSRSQKLLHIRNMALSCIRVGRKLIWLTGWPAQISIESLGNRLWLCQGQWELQYFWVLNHGLNISCENEQIKHSLHWLFSIYALTSQSGRSSTSVLNEEAAASVKKLFTLWSACRKKTKPLQLQGKVWNFPKASQTPLMTLCVGLFERLSLALIFSQTSRNKHSLRGGKTSLGPGDSQSRQEINCMGLEWGWGHLGIITSTPRKASHENTAPAPIVADD